MTIIEELMELRSMPSGPGRARAHQELKARLLMDQEGFLAALTDQSLDPGIRRSLFDMGFRGGTVAFRHNEHLIPLLRKMYVAPGLHHELKHYLDWLIEVHQYPIKPDDDSKLRY